MNDLNRYKPSYFIQIFRLRLVYFFSSFIYLIVAGCNKSNQAPPLTPGYNVYMAGNLDGKAVYWKNGSPIILSDSGNATSIVLNGSDIYACGMTNYGNKPLANYWKNGEQISLENQNLSAALGMTIQGNDIYFVGYIAGLDSVANAVYWKNGILNYLSRESQNVATGILVSGQQVYVSGYTFGSPGDSAVTWENGEKVFFGKFGSMNAVGLNATDTFFLGTLNAEPTYWLQNKMTTLYKNGYANAMAFSGADVYFGGGVRPNLNDNYAAIWKNDSLTILTDQYPNSSVSGVVIAGSDVYAVGYVDAGFNQPIPVYWKNGVMVKLGDHGTVSSISIGR